MANTRRKARTAPTRREFYRLRGVLCRCLTDFSGSTSKVVGLGLEFVLATTDRRSHRACRLQLKPAVVGSRSVVRQAGSGCSGGGGGGGGGGSSSSSSRSKKQQASCTKLILLFALVMAGTGASL